jgi:hypothetical protein
MARFHHLIDRKILQNNILISSPKLGEIRLFQGGNYAGKILELKITKPLQRNSEPLQSTMERSGR